MINLRAAVATRSLQVQAHTEAAVFSAVAPLLLRLVVGIGFFMHGYAKFMRGPDAFAGVLETLGVPAPLLFAWLTMLVEIIGGIAVLLGAYVALVAIPMAIVLLTAMVKVHLPYGFFSVKLAEVTA